MTDLERYQAVNECETLEQLADVIESFADPLGFIPGRTEHFDATKMANICRNYTWSTHNGLTRRWGIRQQAMMILFYKNPWSIINSKSVTG